MRPRVNVRVRACTRVFIGRESEAKPGPGPVVRVVIRVIDRHPSHQRSSEAGAAATNECKDGQRPAAQPRLGRRRRGGSMAASARHPAAQPRPGRRRGGCAITASAAQCPGSWSRKAGSSRTGSQVQWGAGWPAEL